MHSISTGPTMLILPSNLDAAFAPILLRELQEQTKGNVPLDVDASKVENVGIACTQLLLSAAKRNARLKDASIHFTATIADLGISWPEAEAAAPIQAAQPKATEMAEISPQGKRILTIDDSRTIRDMLKLTLVEAGFEVAQAVDGEDGIDVFEKHPFDIVITDINMPRKDGYAVIQHIRRKDSKIPVLVLTTESEREKRDRAREAGATGWIVKPFEPERLIDAIHKVSIR